MSDRCGAVGEHRELARRLFESGQFQRGICGGHFARIGLERIRVARLERVANHLAATGIVDHDEPPRLTQSHRWRETGDFDQSLQCAGGERVGSKPPDIASPNHQVAQAQTKCFIERRKRVHGGFLHTATAGSKTTISTICSTAPRTPRVWPPICRTLNHAMKSEADAARTSPIMVAANPREMPSVNTPRRTATATR